MSWFIGSQREYLKLLKRARFIPIRFLSNNSIKEVIARITKDDRVELEGIVLPPPIDKDAVVLYLHVISDSLLPFLVSDVDEVLYYALMDITPEGPYEYKAVKLEKGDIVIDAGANIGEFSALAGVKGCLAYAFEPMPHVIDAYLSKTAEWNPNIIICEYALSDKSGELVFGEDLLHLGGSSSVFAQKGQNEIKVQAIDLDTFVQENNLPRVDFIKADIEGAERYMLMGAKRVLKEFAPKIAICTYHLPDDPKVLRELILDANPNYVIEERWLKMFAHVPK